MSGPSRVKLVMAIAAFVVALGLAFRVHAFFIWPHAVTVGFDDRYIAPFGMRLLEGTGLPYVDAVSQRGPMLYWAVALFQRIFGPFDWAALRWLAVTHTFVTMAAFFAVGLAVRRPLAGALAAIVFAYVTTYGIEAGGGMGIAGEIVATPFGMLALAAIVWALERPMPERRRDVLLVVGGVMAGLSGLGKQTTLPIVLPLALYVAAVAWTRSPRPFFARRGGVRPVTALVSGWLAPIVTVVGVYAAKGALGTFWYWFYTYNARSHMEPYAGSSPVRLVMGWVNGQPLLMLAIVVVVAGALVAPLLRARSMSARDLVSGYASAGLEVTVGALATIAMLGAFAQFRFWPHHFLPAIAWMALLLGLRMDAMLGAIPRWPSVMASGAMVLAMVSLQAQGTAERLSSLRGARKNGHYVHERANPVCAAIEKYSQPSEPIFIWGFDGDFYVDCQRRPASRFVFTASVAGVVPPRWGESKPVRVAHGAPELLEADLRSARPPVILDFHESLGKGMSMRKIPQLARLLDEDYCQLPEVAARGRTANVWVRRATGRCPVSGQRR